MTTLPVLLHTQGFLALLIWVLACYASPNVYTSKELMMFFKVRCAFRCKYGYETDVEGRPMCKCYDPCKNIYCLGGAKCVIEMPKSCLWESCRPNATCKVRYGQSSDEKPPLYGTPQADAATATASTTRPSARNDVCLLPMVEEDKNCKRLRKRWRFDPDSGKCVKFRGCKSGGNNFGRKKRCKRKCLKKSTKSRRRGGRSRGSGRRSKQ